MALTNTQTPPRLLVLLLEKYRSEQASKEATGRAGKNCFLPLPITTLEALLVKKPL